MIHIERLPEPTVLTNKKAEWTKRFIESGNPRPDSSKYSHTEIKQTLEAMSSNKCFYCERKLHGSRIEVDHYIEVAERKDLAFEWTNLYLSCDSCNTKLSNGKLPNSETLNPCIDIDTEVSKHISFDDEQIISINSSEKGRKTIQKYKLGSERQDYLRLKKLKEFWRILESIRKKQIDEGRKLLNKNEKDVLFRFTDKSSSYSLMFKVLLKSLL